MKAAIYEQYGTTEVIDVRDVPRPEPGPGEVLVRVHAASVNSWDWDRLTGIPRAYRLLSGVRRPEHTIMGSDYAGRIESVGTGVEGLSPGDAVFGDLSPHSWGAFAEYVCAPTVAATKIPAGVSFEQAAVLPQAGALALQGLRPLELREDSELLINGAGGGTGVLAIQLARRAGARVTAVDRTEKLDIMRSLGAERVVDFTKEDFATRGARYDAIFDINCHRPLSHYRRVMKAEGRYTMVGGAPLRILALAAFMPLSRIARSRRRMAIVGIESNRDNAHLADLVARGELSPTTDRAYSLDDVAEAMQRIGDGLALGKLVIRVHDARAVVGQ